MVESPPDTYLVLLDGETTPRCVRSPQLIPANFRPGDRVMRHSGGPCRFGYIAFPGECGRKLVLARMGAEQESVIVRWDNGDYDVVVKTDLTPIVYAT